MEGDYNINNISSKKLLRHDQLLMRMAANYVNAVDNGSQREIEKDRTGLKNVLVERLRDMFGAGEDQQDQQDLENNAEILIPNIAAEIRVWRKKAEDEAAAAAADDGRGLRKRRTNRRTKRRTNRRTNRRTTRRTKRRTTRRTKRKKKKRR